MSSKEETHTCMGTDVLATMEVDLKIPISLCIRRTARFTPADKHRTLCKLRVAYSEAIPMSAVNLSQCQTPQATTDGNELDARLNYMPECLVWHCGLRIYGWFLKDTVVRGDHSSCLLPAALPFQISVRSSMCGELCA